MKPTPELDRWLAIARGLLNCPTAPLMEDLPARRVLDFARERKLRVRRDRAGNILLCHPASAFSHTEPLVLVAHLDHPGFWISSSEKGTVELQFRGGVKLEHARPGTKIRFFRRGRVKATGRGVLLKASGARDRLEQATARVTSGRAEPGGFAMWDFPGFALKSNRIVARCCDDLLGVAAALCVLDEAHRRKLKAPLWVLLTRAEEVGFFGTLLAVKDRIIPPRARVISLECSRALAHAPQGEGVIVRVGDAASLFDASFTEALRQAGLRLRAGDPAFKFQRRLMDGGACEATAFCAAGYRASGLALPLGNYHNQSERGTGKGIGPEHVMLEDFAAEVRLLLELASLGRGLKKLEATIGKMLAERTRAAEVEFKATPLLEA